MMNYAGGFFFLLVRWCPVLCCLELAHFCCTNKCKNDGTVLEFSATLFYGINDSK